MKIKYSYPAAFVLTLSIFCSACKISKDVAVPDAGLPASYRAEKLSSDTASIGAIPWETFFADQELRSLITDALAHNNDLQVAIKNIASSRLVLQQAKLGNIPTVDVGAAASSSRPSDNSINGLSLNQQLHTTHVEDYTIAASLSWEADIWGKIKNQRAAALASYLSSEAARKAVQTKVVSDVAKGYYNLLMLDAQLTIAVQNVRLNDSTLYIIQLQFEAGQVTSLAVQQARAQKLTAAALVPQFESQIAVQENAISILAGRMPSPVARNLHLDNVEIPEKLSAGLPAFLLGNRPDVMEAELALSKANADVGYAKANMYPSLTITAQGGLDAFKASNWFTLPASLFGAVAGSLTQPLFEQKKLSTRYRVAKVTRDETVIKFRQSVLVAVGEISDAMVKLDKLKQQKELVMARTTTLQQAIGNSQLLFKNGLATYLEVITAQGNVLQSELELASVKNAQLSAEVDLYRSVGGGWK